MLTGAARQAGITLVELMIASTIALFALAAVLNIYAATAHHATQHLRQADLHQQLYAVLQMMRDDLRRSGYWSFDPALHNPVDNPFNRPANRLRVAAYSGEAKNSCILFAYDLDRDGLVGQGRCARDACPPDSDDDNVEQWGYRLRDGLIQARYGGAEFSCDSGYWQAVTDRSIEITRLEFDLHAICTRLIEAQQVCVPGSARLVQRAVLSRLAGRPRQRQANDVEISGWTRIRNDLLLEGDT